MPYIKNRAQVEVSGPSNPGELNYLLTKLVHEYVQRQGVSYATLNEALGVLEAAKAEFYRAVVAPYEDAKLLANGPISALDQPEFQKLELAAALEAEKERIRKQPPYDL